MYRRWTPAGRGVEKQLILPKRCRRTVLKLAHEIPIAGHLGNEKTRQHLLRRFYWPGVFNEVEEFCRSCSTCQKTSQQREMRAPLILLPIISEPFSWIATDIMGPPPRSRSGNQYVLVICNYAIWYPGGNSALQHRCRAHRGGDVKEDSAYGGKVWDRMIPYRLFTCREVPQSSTRFSSFELLYGQDLRGPLNVLKETWEAGVRTDETVLSFVLETQLKAMADMVKENVEKSQERQKHWYDKGAREWQFEVGDPSRSY